MATCDTWSKVLTIAQLLIVHCIHASHRANTTKYLHGMYVSFVCGSIFEPQIMAQSIIQRPSSKIETQCMRENTDMLYVQIFKQTASSTAVVVV